MRLHRFYINTPIGANKPRVAEQSSLRGRQLTIDNQQLLHQWRSVFRMVVGEKVILFDGSGSDFLCEIAELGKKEAEVRVLEEKKGIIPDKEVWLFFSLIKKDNAEMVLQKCTELGVSHFVPVISERSAPAQTFSAEKLRRARKILIEASEQCGRSNLPELHLPTLGNSQISSYGKASEIMLLEDAIKKYKDKLDLLAFDSSGEPNYSLNAKRYPLGLLIGSEGGFTENELDLFKQNNIPVYSLGDLTLRAETAAIVASAKLLST